MKSKWYYQLEIQQTVTVVIGLHQEDAQIEGVAKKRGYLDIGLAIFKKNPDNTLDIKMLPDNKLSRQIEIELV